MTRDEKWRVGSAWLSTLALVTIVVSGLMFWPKPVYFGQGYVPPLITDPSLGCDMNCKIKQDSWKITVAKLSAEHRCVASANWPKGQIPAGAVLTMDAHVHGAHAANVVRYETLDKAWTMAHHGWWTQSVCKA